MQGDSNGANYGLPGNYYVVTPSDAQQLAPPSVDVGQLLEQQALEAERHSLAIAMAESLTEDQDRKAAERPLDAWKDEDLLERYKASNILREHPEGAAALGQACCRKDFVDSLEFERKALRWFPVSGTGSFFTSAARLAASRAMAVHTLAQYEHLKAKRGSRSKSRAAEKSQPSTSERVAYFVADLSKQIKSAKDAVYGMPSGDIPEVFRSKSKESDEDSDVEFLEEVSPKDRKKQKVHNLC